MTIDAWMRVILFGGLCGALGQSLRVIVGLKKLGDASAQRGTALRDEIIPSAMVVSLLIGFVAGALAALGLDLTTDAGTTKETVTALIAAGYSGADFIEGFMSRYLPQRSDAPRAASAGGAPPIPPDVHQLVNARAARLPDTP